MLFLGILLHISLFHVSMSEVAPCNISKPIGANVLIPLPYKGLTADAHLKWMHGKERVFYSKGGEIKDEKRKIKFDGSLKLDNIKSSDSGTYEATVHDSKGAHVHFSSQRLCVLESVKTPEVKYSCAGQWPVLTCTRGGPEVNVIWYRNNQEIGQRQQTLTLTADLFKAGDRYSCTVKNQVSEKKSSEVKPVCSGKIQVNTPTVTFRCDKGTMQMTCVNSTGMVFSWNRNGQKLVGKDNTILNLPEAEFKSNHTYSCVIKNGTTVIQSKNVQPSCKVAEQSKWPNMDLWLMVTILAGGGLVVVLIILSIVCCLCKCKKSQEKEKELRLANLTHSPDNQSEETPLKRPRRERGPLPEVPKPRVRPAQLHNSGQPGPDMVKNSQYMHMVEFPVDR
ncbi:uncharacterized protein LOC125292092 isoform X1 [Alosa alosa]|nr:uncharacterized protein LOC125292092 isoform X1 [Alosa alosa]